MATQGDLIALLIEKEIKRREKKAIAAILKSPSNDPDVLLAIAKEHGVI